MKLKATIANLNLFNSGIYKDVTVSFPASAEMLRSALRSISIDGRENTETLVMAYETDVKGLAVHLSEYESIDELNYLAGRLAALSPDEMCIFTAAVQHGEYSGNLQDLINLTYNLDCFTLYPGITDAETYGRVLLNEIEEVEIPERIKPYIDYEAYGEDATINEGGEFTASGYVYNNRTPFRDVYDGNTIPREYAVFIDPFLLLCLRRMEASV